MMDANGFIHTSKKVFIIDADGNPITKTKKDKQPKKPLKRSPTPPSVKGYNPTKEDLMMLEDAIFNSPVHRKRFLRYVMLTERATSWQNTTQSSLKTTVRHCWETLNWRPLNGRVVKKNPNNKYIK